MAATAAMDAVHAQGEGWVEAAPLWTRGGSVRHPVRLRRRGSWAAAASSGGGLGCDLLVFPSDVEHDALHGVDMPLPVESSRPGESALAVCWKSEASRCPATISRKPFATPMKALTVSKGSGDGGGNVTLGERRVAISRTLIRFCGTP